MGKASAVTIKHIVHKSDSENWQTDEYHDMILPVPLTLTGPIMASIKYEFHSEAIVDGSNPRKDSWMVTTNRIKAEVRQAINQRAEAFYAKDPKIVEFENKLRALYDSSIEAFEKSLESSCIETSLRPNLVRKYRYDRQEAIETLRHQIECANNDCEYRFVREVNKLLQYPKVWKRL